MSLRSCTMRRQEKSFRRAVILAAALAAFPFLAGSFLLSSSALHAQAAQSGSSNSPKTNAATPDKSNPATPASSSAAPKTDAASTQDSRARTSATSATAQKPAEKGAGMVWVNTATGVYHKPGTRWYGKTKKGKYMLETDAIKAGYRAAK